MININRMLINPTPPKNPLHDIVVFIVLLVLLVLLAMTNIIFMNDDTSPGTFEETILS